MLALATPGLTAFNGPALAPTVSMPAVSMMARKAPAKKGSFGSLKKSKTDNIVRRYDNIDVATGKAYESVTVSSVWSSGQYDEIGVLPPIGRWDPLQIREQVRFALAPLLGLSAAHAPRCGLAIRASGSWREGGHMTAGSAVAKFSAILLLPWLPISFFSGCLAGRLHTRVSAYTLIQFSHSHWISFGLHRVRSATAVLWRWRSSTAASQWPVSSAS